MRKNIKIQKSIKLDRYVFADLFLVFLLSNQAIRILIGRCFGILRIPTMTIFATSLVVFLPLILHFLKSRRVNRNLVYSILLVFAVILFFFVSYTLHPSYAEWYMRSDYGVWDAVLSPISGSIYTIFVFAIVNDLDRVKKDFRYVAVLNFFTCGYQMIVALTRGYWEAYNARGEIIKSTYNVDFGYEALFVALLFLIYFILEQKQIIKLIFFAGSVISTFWVIAYGSRGAIFSYGVGIILIVGYQIRRLSVMKQIAVWMTSFTGVVLLISFYDVIVEKLYNLLRTANISSRTIAMLLSGDFMDKNGRDSISNMAIDIIRNQSIWGSGAFGDRPIIGTKYFWGYCHNIALEFFIDFGLIFGSIFLIALIIKCIRYYLNCNSWDQVGIFIVIFSVNMKLFFSDTFWGFKYFWLLISLLLFMSGSIYKKRRFKVTSIRSNRMPLR